MVNARRRKLTEELELINAEISFYRDYDGEAAEEYFSLIQWSKLAEQRARIYLELARIKRITKPQRGLTDADIEAARSVPITRVVEFGRGKSKCFNHADKNPSMYHGTRSNRAVCPVCGKSWSAIDVLIDRDGMTFIEAVRYLI